MLRHLVEPHRSLDIGTFYYKTNKLGKICGTDIDPPPSKPTQLPTPDYPVAMDYYPPWWYPLPIHPLKIQEVAVAVAMEVEIGVERQHRRYVHRRFWIWPIKGHCRE